MAGLREFELTLNGFHMRIRCETNPFDCDNVKVHYPLSIMDVRAIERVINGFTIVPDEEITSFKNLYYVLRVLIDLNIEYHGSFDSWGIDSITNSEIRQRIISLSDPEYILFISAYTPRLISVKTMGMIFGISIVNILQVSISIIDELDDPDTVVKAIAILQNIQFEDDAVHKLYADTIAKYHSKLLLNPFSERFANYFKYQTPHNTTYNSNGISRYPAMVSGDQAIVSADEFKARWNVVSCGLFDKPQNPAYEGEFPWDNCFVGGGAVSRILRTHFKNTNNFDIDLFVIGKDRNDRVDNIRKVLKWFEGPNTYFTVLGSVVNVFIIDQTRVIQLITNDKLNMFDVISSFDSSHLQFAYNNKGVFGTCEGFNAMQHMIAHSTNMGRFKPERFIKALYEGFDVVYDDEFKQNSIMDISNFVTDPENNPALKNIIAGFYKYWLPRDDSTLDPAERDMYIKEEIKLHVACSVVVNSTTEVMKHITVGGNFEIDYAATNFRSLDLSNINVKKFIRGRQFDVSDHRGVMRFTSDLMTIKEIKQGREQMQIICDNVRGSDFDNFLRVVDDVLYGKFTHGAPDVCVGNQDTIIWNILNRGIDTQAERGIEILKNQRGDPLDVTAQLSVGDTIRLLFKIHIVLDAGWRGDRQRGAMLFANRIVKHEREEDLVDDDEGNNSDLED